MASVVTRSLGEKKLGTAHPLCVRSDRILLSAVRRPSRWEQLNTNMLKQPNAHADRARAGLEYMRRFLREYVLEWQRTDQRTLVRLSQALQAVAATVNDADVVLLVKPGGFCPFCNRCHPRERRGLASSGPTSIATACAAHARAHCMYPAR